MKKCIPLLFLCCFILVSCSNSTQTNMKKVTVTTSFLEDIVRQLAKDYVSIETVVPAGEDPHLYVAKTSDLDKLTHNDLLLYHGLHFEGKMVSILEKNGYAITSNFPLDKLQTENDTVDPHFWFDISLYKLAVKNISEKLISLLPKQQSQIEQNTKNYLHELDQLDKYIQTRVSEIPENSRYLITPHDAFNYLASSYNLTVHAPQGISTNSEVDNNAMIKTVDLIIKHKVKAIFTESTTNPKRMQKLQEAVKAKGFHVNVISGENKELFSDSLAPTNHPGDTYIDMYKHNIDLIVENLK